jgi:hypothetical protein
MNSATNYEGPPSGIAEAQRLHDVACEARRLSRDSVSAIPEKTP